MADGLLGMAQGQQAQAQPQGGLFGGAVQTPSNIRRAERNRLMGNAIQLAQSPSALMASGAAQAGLGIGRALGFETEGDRTARIVEQVQRESLDRGLTTDSDPMGALNFAQRRFQELGAPELATRVQQQAAQMAPEPQERTINAIGGTPLANQLSRIYGVNIPEGQSYEISITGNRVTDINSLGAQTNVSQTVEGQQQRSPFMERMDENSADQAAERTEAGTVARNLRQTLVDIEDTITSPGLETGAVQPLITPIQALAESVNVNLTEIADRAGIPLGDLETKEEFNRLSNILTTEMFSKFKGNLNDREVRIAQESVTNLGASPEANRKAVASLLASAEIADEYATRVSQVRNREEYLALEKEKTERGVEEFKKRRDEILERLNRKTYINKANQAIDNGAADVRRYVEAANAEELDALPEETRQNIANILGGS